MKKEQHQQKNMESDSEPSCDNFDEAELAERFEAALSEDDEPLFKPPLAQKPPQRIKRYDSPQKLKPQPQPLTLAIQNPNIELTSDINRMVKDLGEMRHETKKLTRKFDQLSQQINAKIINEQ